MHLNINPAPKLIIIIIKQYAYQEHNGGERHDRYGHVDHGDRPPRHDRGHEVRDERAEHDGERGHGRQRAPEPGLDRLAHVRQHRRLAQAHAQAERYARHVQIERVAGPPQHVPAHQLRHAYQGHAPLAADDVLQHARQQASRGVAHQQHASVPRRFRFRQGHVVTAAAAVVRHQRPYDHRRYGQRHAESQHYHVLHDDRTDLRITKHSIELFII